MLHWFMHDNAHSIRLMWPRHYRSWKAWCNPMATLYWLILSIVLFSLSCRLRIENKGRDPHYLFNTALKICCKGFSPDFIMRSRRQITDFPGSRLRIYKMLVFLMNYWYITCTVSNCSNQCLLMLCCYILFCYLHVCICFMYLLIMQTLRYIYN